MASPEVEGIDDPTNWVIRVCRDVAPGGVSVFWKKFRMLRFFLAEEDFVEEAGPFEGVDAFLANDPAIAWKREKRKGR